MGDRRQNLWTANSIALMDFATTTQMGRVEHLTLTSGDVNCCLLRRGGAIRSARDPVGGY